MTYSRIPAAAKETEAFPDEWDWLPVRDGDPRAVGMYRRHYSSAKNPHPLIRQFIGPGEKMALLTQNGRALFAWRKFKDDSGQQGVNCAVFRVERTPSCHNSSHPHCPSNLIVRACELAWSRWPGERLYTYVDPKAIHSGNPGYCFKRAGWKRCGETRSGLVVLEARPS